MPLNNLNSGTFGVIHELMKNNRMLEIPNFRTLIHFNMNLFKNRYTCKKFFKIHMHICYFGQLEFLLSFKLPNHPVLK